MRKSSRLLIAVLTVKNKIGLVGTAVSDHPDLIKICQYIVDHGAQAGIGSLRLDKINESIVEILKAGGIETIALAPRGRLSEAA